MRSLVKKSMPDWHLFITQMITKWTKWYAMSSHVIAYRSLELLFGTHTFNFICFFDDFNCVFMQIRCLSRLLIRDKKAQSWIGKPSSYDMRIMTAYFLLYGTEESCSPK